MNQESERIEALFEKLYSSVLYRFPAVGENLSAPTGRGVYIILSSHGMVLHVGNTPRGKNGINQRLKNHLSGSSSFTKVYLGGNGSILRKGHFYKFLLVPSARHRALLEAYAIGKLCPKHIGHG